MKRCAFYCNAPQARHIFSAFKCVCVWLLGAVLPPLGQLRYWALLLAVKLPGL